MSPPATTTMTVTNVAPSATFSAPAAADEGSAIALALSNVNDPSPKDHAAGFSYAFDCGTGFGDFGASAAASCPTTDNAIVNVAARIQDKDGGVATYTASVTLNNVSPTAVFTTPPSTGEGQAQVLTLANVVDPSSADISAGLQIAFDCGTGSGFGAFSLAATASCIVPDNGTRTVRARIRDKDGGENEYGTTATTTNRAPSITMSLSGSGDPGSSLLVTANGTDPSPIDRTLLQYAFDCGTGGGLGVFSSSPTAMCTLGAFGTQRITAAVRDKDGAQVGTFQILPIINAMDLQPGKISLSGTATISVYLYSTAAFNATLADPVTVRLVLDGSGLAGAPVMLRNGVPMAGAGDYNGDGRLDRLFVFQRSALQAAGLATSATPLTLVQTSGSITFTARDATPPSIVP